MLPTKENIENKFREKFDNHNIVVVRVSNRDDGGIFQNPIGQEVLDFILQIQKDTIEAIRLKEIAMIPELEGSDSESCMVWNEAVHCQQSLIDKLL